MSALSSLTTQLTEHRSLSDAQVAEAVVELITEEVTSETKAEFLMALARKGETAEEIAAFAHALRERSLAPPLDVETRARGLLDVVGTGGDHCGTFNISTAAALLAAAAGVTVAKHGNRAITSRTGSADVLEALGVPIELAPEAAARMLRERGFAFFFAPRYHPAFKHIGPARRLCAARGQRTLFNFLGPLLNPVRPGALLLGVPRPELCEPLARVLQTMGASRAMVVCGCVGPAVAADAPRAFMDELSTVGDNTVAEFYQERGLAVGQLSPAVFPCVPATAADLAGGDRDENAALIHRLFRGEERGPKRDAVLLNAGAALLVAGKARSIAEGWDVAAGLIDGGHAATKLEMLVGWKPAGPATA